MESSASLHLSARSHNEIVTEMAGTINGEGSWKERRKRNVKRKR
jgi:hypothetical protein